MPRLQRIITTLVDEAQRRFGVEISSEEINSLVTEAISGLLKLYLFPYFAKAANASNPLYKLDAYTFGHICKYLTVRETYNFGLVSKWTRQMIEPIFMRNKVLVIGANVKPKDLIWVKDAYSYITTLKLRKSKIENVMIATAFKEKLIQLKSLHLENCSLVDIHLLGDCCANIQHLTINAPSDNKTTICSLVRNLKHIRSFCGPSNYLENMSADLHKSIVNLELICHFREVSETLEKFTNLKTLKLKNCEQFRLSLINSCVLSKLHFESVELIHTRFETEIFKSVKELYLNIRNLSVDLFSHFSNLESLSLKFDKSNGHLTKDHVTTISQIGSLRHLTVTENSYGKHDPQNSAENSALLTAIVILSSVEEIFYTLKPYVSFKDGWYDHEDVVHWVQANAVNAVVNNAEPYLPIQPAPEQVVVNDNNWDGPWFQEHVAPEFKQAIRAHEKLAFNNFCNSLITRTDAEIKMRQNQKVTFSLSCEGQVSRKILPNFVLHINHSNMLHK